MDSQYKEDIAFLRAQNERLKEFRVGMRVRNLKSLRLGTVNALDDIGWTMVVETDNGKKESWWRGYWEDATEPRKANARTPVDPIARRRAEREAWWAAHNLHHD